MNNNLSAGDIEVIEKIIYKSVDDIAVSLMRSFERLEDRIDAMESRIYTRMADIEEKIEYEAEKLKGDILDSTVNKK